jgi:hypothetical protein
MSVSSEISGPKDNWPHKFVKDGKEELYTPPGGQYGDVIKIVPMICVCCHTRYTLNKDPQPAGPCPARNDKTELQRLHGGR